MKNKILLLLLLSAQAQGWWESDLEVQTFCKESVKQNKIYRRLFYPVLHLDKSSLYMTHQKENDYLLKKDRITGETIWKISLKERTIRIQTNQKYLFLLTKKSLEQRLKSTGEFVRKIEFKQASDQALPSANIRDLAVFQDTLLVAHGTLGIDMYFGDDQELTFSQNIVPAINNKIGHQSMVTGLSFSPDGLQIVASVDNATVSMDGKAFEGFIILDSYYLNIIKQLPIKQKNEALGFPKINWTSDNTWEVDNMGVYLKYKTELTRRKKHLLPIKRLLGYSKGGRLIGEAFTINHNLYHCEMIGGPHQKRAVSSITKF